MTIQNRFKLEEEVYLKTDVDQSMRLVTGIIVRPFHLLYELTCGSDVSEHYEFEISKEENVLLKTSG